MVRLTWDKPSIKYTHGVDQVVLYTSSGYGYSWSGVTNIETQVINGDSEPLYQDGIRWYQNYSQSELSASLSCFTFPDVFDRYLGYVSDNNGLIYDNQSRERRFSLSWRTIEVSPSGKEYQVIHILYNASVDPITVGYQTMSNTPTPNLFNFNFSSLPVIANSMRPTSHFMIDSRTITESSMRGIEDILYGYSGSNARLPSIDMISDAVAGKTGYELVTNTRSGINNAILGASKELTGSHIDGRYIPGSSSGLVIQRDGLFKIGT